VKVVPETRRQLAWLSGCEMQLLEDVQLVEQLRELA
jgi:hypothetical protein